VEEKRKGRDPHSFTFMLLEMGQIHWVKKMGGKNGKKKKGKGRRERKKDRSEGIEVIHPTPPTPNKEEPRRSKGGGEKEKSFSSLFHK